MLHILSLVHRTRLMEAARMHTVDMGYLGGSPLSDVPAIILLHRLGRKTAGIFT